MKALAVSTLAIAASILSLGGCTASQSRTEAWNSTEVALAVLGPANDEQSHFNGEFRLGAGDTLGRAVYRNYVTVVRANPNMQYASGETTGN